MKNNYLKVGAVYRFNRARLKPAHYSGVMDWNFLGKVTGVDSKESTHGTVKYLLKFLPGGDLPAAVQEYAFSDSILAMSAELVLDFDAELEEIILEDQ